MNKITAILGLAIVLFSCTKNNPDPSWLEVSEWQLVENVLGNDAGELTENFTDAWVYVDDHLIGVFEVPFKIPLLLEGASQVKLFPTVHNNGISATKKIYPFVEEYVVNVELVKNQVTHIDPVTKYKTGVQFTILDFEDANLGIEENPSSTTSIYASNDPLIIQPFNGNSFGRVSLTDANRVWSAATNLDQDLPGSGSEVYLEIDFLCTEDLITGLYAITGTESVHNINVQLNEQEASTAVWKKVYVELKTIVSGSLTADYFEHSFDATLDASKTQGEINIDNIKVVHF